MRGSLIAFIALAALTQLCVATPVLKKVFVLHRHGARSSFGYSPIGEVLCDYPYCQLTDAGKAQCLTLGQFLRQRYTGILSNFYDVTTMQSTSTSPERVVLSSQSVILGMFSDALPFVDYVPDTEDVQMSWWSAWPTFTMHKRFTVASDALDAWTTEFMTQAVIDQMALEFGIEPLCVLSSTRCVNHVSDMLASNFSNGSPIRPWVLALEPKLRVVTARLLSRVNGHYPDTDPYCKQTGSYGFPLATAALAALSAPYAPSGFNYNFILRGAHDWTIVGFLSALGTWTPAVEADPQFAPAFAEAILLDYYVDDITNAVTIKAYRASTGQQFSADYSYQTVASEIGIRCLSSGGVLSWSNTTGSPGCPIDDVQRFINTTAGAFFDPPCYATTETLTNNSCAGDAAPDAGSICAFFREVCVSSGCGLNAAAFADPSSGYSCALPVNGSGSADVGASSSNDVPVTMFGVVTAVSAVVGLIAGVFLSKSGFGKASASPKSS